MKTITKMLFFGLLASLAVSLVRIPPAAAQPGPPISFRTFYDALSPYGQWVTHPAYGSVWVPDAGPGFQPYGTGGYWVMTEYGNTWVSDYEWGWAPFHYGRWFYDDYYGWSWLPGHEWGPAWVAWRSGGGYYGWAPLGPGVDIRVNIAIPARHWVFVPQRYIIHPQPYRYCAPRHQVVNIYHNSVHIHNTYHYNNQVYVSGPPREEIGRATRREVPVYRVEEANRPGRSVARNGSVAVYRPRVTPDAESNSRPSRGEIYSRPYRSETNSRPSRTEAYPNDRGNPRSDAYPNDRRNAPGKAYPEERGNAGVEPNSNDRSHRNTGAPGSRRPAEDRATPGEAGRSGRSERVPAEPSSPRGETYGAGSRPERRSYPAETAPQQPAPERGTYPSRSSRETGAYGQQPESGRERGRTRSQPEAEQPSRTQSQPRPQRQPAARDAAPGSRESSGSSRSRQG